MGKQFCRRACDYTFLKWHGLTVDGIIISHQHNDHIGGLSIIQKYYPQAWLMSTSNQLVNDFACIAGERIKWQHLTFDLLWPERLVPHAGNGDSCVVKISDGQFSILLTGDLERQQEYLLAAKYRQQLFHNFYKYPIMVVILRQVMRFLGKLSHKFHWHQHHGIILGNCRHIKLCRAMRHSIYLLM